MRHGLEVKSALRCHAGYSWICVTPHLYNETQFPWDKIKKHLQGIWHDANSSLDLANLHSQIQNLANAPPIDIDIAKEAERFIKSLSFRFPSLHDVVSFGIEIVLILFVILVFLSIMPCCMHIIINHLNRTTLEVKKMKLHAKQDELPMKIF